MKGKSIILIFLSFMLYGCFSERDASVVALLVNPSSVSAVTGEKIYFDVSVSTLNDAVSSFSVSSFDSENGERALFHSEPGIKEYKERIVCEMPNIKGDSSVVTFFFEAQDNTGQLASCQRNIMVYSGDGGMLKERSGYILYSPWSGKDDSFSFETMQTGKMSPETMPDMYLDAMSDDEDVLPRTLSTATDVVFSKSVTYDYAGATWGGLQTVLKSSVRSDSVDDLETGDVILVGREIQTEDGMTLKTVGVIRIMAIYDEAGKSDDRIVFNLKAQ